MTKIIFMGTPDFSTTVLEMLIAEHDVIAVVNATRSTCWT